MAQFKYPTNESAYYTRLQILCEYKIACLSLSLSLSFSLSLSLSVVIENSVTLSNCYHIGDSRIALLITASGMLPKEVWNDRATITYKSNV